MQFWLIASFLSFKEIWRNRSRFLSVSLVIALITVLVLFVAALGEGLGNGNREYLQKLDAQLVVYQEQSDLLIAGSRLARSTLNAVRRVEGVDAAGLIATSNATLLLPNGEEQRVSMLGVEAGSPAEPIVQQGAQLSTSQSSEVILDLQAALRTGLQVGDPVTLRVNQAARDEYYTLTVAGISDGRQYSLQPTIFVPYFTWDEVRPKSEAELLRSDLSLNVIAVRLSDPTQVELVKQRLETQVDNVAVADIDTAIKNVPGYSAQQSTIQTQGIFTLLIGVLVIGGFFQIQILQKVAQIGVLKAIGAPNLLVGLASVIQIVMVTTIGVAIGGLGVFLLSLGFPPTIPIVFNGQSTALAVIALLLIGPVGGLVSIRYAVRIEPLRALGLGG
ncbi:MAG: ABC transporter permease [Anaerolineales bacterium]|jgi:putative ABC transport system permease protein|nr:ABC transporter permease [Anaerolineales bacterium]